jgi:hypothetical protein
MNLGNYIEDFRIQRSGNIGIYRRINKYPYNFGKYKIIRSISEVDRNIKIYT